MPKVAIVGTGLIGRSWAMIFARAGWTVALTDPAPGAVEAALLSCQTGLDDLAAHGLCEDPALAIDRIAPAETLADALKGSELVQESGPEHLDVKKEIFGELDRLAPPGAILASSTSAIQCSRFTAELAGRARCLVAHPINPPHLVPVVELSGSAWTSTETVERARTIFASIGQVPITVKKEIDGFILNRLQAALLTEALRLVQEGYVSPEDLDRTVKDGLGLRWALMGPLETIALNAPNGIADYCARYGETFQRFAAEPLSPGVWDRSRTERVAQAWSGVATPAAIAERTRWRDRRLAALLVHKHSQPQS